MLSKRWTVSFEYDFLYGSLPSIPLADVAIWSLRSLLAQEPWRFEPNKIYPNVKSFAKGASLDFNSGPSIQLANLENASEIYSTCLKLWHNIDTVNIGQSKQWLSKCYARLCLAKGFNDQVCSNLKDTSSMSAWHTISCSNLGKRTHNPSSNSTSWIDSTLHFTFTWTFEIMLQNQTSKPLLSEAALTC